MGFFDSAQDLLNRGMAATERGTRTLSLKTQLGDANRQRERALAALGESLFAATCNDASFRVGREELYRAIEEANQLRDGLERQIADVEAESAAARAAAAGARPCPNCGATVEASHNFCASCGTAVPPLAQGVEAADAAGVAGAGPDAGTAGASEPVSAPYEVIPDSYQQPVTEIKPENVSDVEPK